MIITKRMEAMKTKIESIKNPTPIQIIIPMIIDQPPNLLYYKTLHYLFFLFSVP